MAGEKINYQYISEYIKSVIPQSISYLEEMEKYARENKVPVIHKEVKAFIEVLLKISKPERILEIGSAIGYSALVMAEASDACITTIERDPQMFNIAADNIEKAGKKERIKIIGQDALQVLPYLKNSYDFMFMDAAKGSYREFYDYGINLVRKGGIILCDNILYKGMTALGDDVGQKQRTIVNKMRDFVEMLFSDERIDNCIIPIGDGMCLSYVK